MTNKDDEEKKKHNEMIRNIIIGVVILLLLALGVVVYMKVYNKQGKSSEPAIQAFPRYRFQFFG